MPGSYSLPNPSSPNTNDALTSLPIRQNFQSIQGQINNADGAALNAGSVPESALATGINSRLAATYAGLSYVVSGLNIATPGSGLVVTVPAGIAYVNGYYVSYAGGSVTVTASQDSYLDITFTGAVVSQGVANNAAAPTLTPNSLRIAKIVANANIVQVLQNQINVAPVAPNTTNWFGFDSIGNPVYNTNPNNKLLFLTQTATGSSQGGTTTTTQSVAVLFGPVQTFGFIVPAQVQRVKFTLALDSVSVSAASNFAKLWLVQGTNPQTTANNVINFNPTLAGNSAGFNDRPALMEAIWTPTTPGFTQYCIAFSATNATYSWGNTIATVEVI